MLKLIEGFYLGKAEPESGGGGSAPVIEELNVTPTTSAQVITAPSGTDGYNPVNVSAVTSSIDENIQAENIKEGVTILNVTGTLSGGEKFGAIINSVIGDIDSNGVLQAPTEQTDLVFTGVTDLAQDSLRGRFQSNNITSVSFPDLTTISGNSALYGTFWFARNLTSFSAPLLTSITTASACNGAFKQTNLQSINLPELETISTNGYYCCQEMFSQATINMTSALTFPKLKTISGEYAVSEMLYGSGTFPISFPELTTMSGGNCGQKMLAYSNCTSLSMPKLTSISGDNIWQEFLNNNFKITTLTFPELTTVNGYLALSNAFGSMNSLTSVSFPKLTTITGTNPFGSNFSGMFNYSTALTEIHFKSDMQSTISAITGYANKWGATNATIYFDL